MKSLHSYIIYLGILLSFIVLNSCAWANHKIASRKGFNREARLHYSTKSVSSGEILKGKASYYGPGFHGKLTANGETYDQEGMTCAHKTLPFNTKLKVTNLANGKSVIVRVTDRGPYAKGRILDLTVKAARKLDMIKSGVANVQAEVLN